VTIVDIELRVC